jgi:CubicO group peptidase (beta-lactamase class C family)
MSLTIRRGGKVVLDRAIGHARGNEPGSREKPVLATPDTLFNMFSASKCVTSMLIHMYDDRGHVHLDDAVAEYIPEFARNGKQHITIRHLLTHRAGIPLTPPGHASLDVIEDPAKVIALICDAEPISLAGRKQAYHALAGGFIMAEILAGLQEPPLRRLARPARSGRA